MAILKTEMKNYAYSLAVHGGAGTIRREDLSADQERAYRTALENAVSAGYTILEQGGSALDAVEAAVAAMEDSELFNAGRGSVFTHDERIEMDAAIMCGHSLDAGSVAAVEQVRNPIRLARRVLDRSPHVMLGGAGALQFARDQGLPMEPLDYFATAFRRQQLDEARAADRVQLDHQARKPDKYGTVGAVAKDAQGHLAAATSTGGITNKRYGRIGDSPITGAGNYANDATCAVSCTGFGEYFMRAVAAYDLSCLMEYKGLSLWEAARHLVLDKLPALGGEGGLIAVDARGRLVLPFNSEGMYRAWQYAGEEIHTAVFE